MKLVIQDSDRWAHPNICFQIEFCIFFSLKISKLESKILASCQVLQFKLLLIWIELLFAEADWGLNNS